MLDFLGDAIDLGVELGRVLWKTAGANTVALGLAGLAWSGYEVLTSDTWFLAVVGVTGLGLLVGWVIDLAVRLIMRPLARAGGMNPSSWRADLVLGLPLTALALWQLTSRGWI